MDVLSEPAWLLGVPVDIVDTTQAIAAVQQAIQTREPLVFATPNANFLSLSSRDAPFQQAVLRTGMSLADGMPLVWLARGLRVPLVERVAGSTLFERLVDSGNQPPVRVFFFGGPPGAAQTACAALGTHGSGATCAGWLYPDFGSIESMSTPQILECLNASGADFLVVALGASKGHRWIEAVRDQVKIPVISHLGAVVNFAAGTLRRAPPIVQRMGLEWAWRIREEPSLWTRYLKDAVHLMRLVSLHVIPIRLHGAFCKAAPLTLTSTLPDTSRTLRLEGGLCSSAVRQAKDYLVLHKHIEEIDVSGVTSIDAIGLGFLYAARFRGMGGRRFLLRGRPQCRRLVAWHQARSLFEVPPEVQTPG